ncbi:MAG: hypothetical protein ACXVX9_02965 [Mycobacteriaceae bacterium]
MAVDLWIASIVVGLIALLASFSSIGPLVRQELDSQLASNPDLASVDRETIIRIASYAVVAVNLLGVALRVFLVVKLAAGRRWARTILTVLGALSVAGAVLNVRSGTAVDAAVSVLQALLVAAAIVYMFSEGAKAYFSPTPCR